MKRLIFLPVAAAATVFSIAGTPLPGDVNGDGIISMADANAITNYCNGNAPEGFDASLADVNGDGVVTSDDAHAVVAIYLGLADAPSSDMEEMTGAAMYVKMSSGETAVFDVSAITARSLNAQKDSFVVTTAEGRFPFALAELQERTYGDMPQRLTVAYQQESATVVNPFYSNGLRSEITGAHVTLTNADVATERTMELSGTTSNGSFVYNGSYKTTIALNGVDITNPDGAAIDIECGKRVALLLTKGTTNTLADGANGSQKAALYCKGHLEIDKAGTLNVTGNTAHAISAKEYIQLKKSDGNINILGAVKDGIHCKQYFLANGYNINIKGVGDDGIQAELDGEPNDEGYDDGSVIIKNGTYTIENTADGGKGITADGAVSISGEATVIDITANGAGGVEKADASTSTGDAVAKSYRVYVSLPATGTSGGGFGGPQGSSNYWKSLYLYNSSGTLVATLTSTVSKTSGYTTKTFYYYDFKASDSGTYYFMSDNYTSSGGGRPGGSSTTYTIKSGTFTGPTSGEDYYYEISNSYTTSGSTRTFSLSNVTNTWNGSTSDTAEDTGEAYSAAGIKAEGNITISEGSVTVRNSGSMSKSIKSKATVQIDGGNITLTPTGAMQVINNDASYSTGVKAVDFIQNEGTLTINATGAAGRGISATNVTTNGGSITITNSGNGQQGSNDSYTAKGIKGDSKVALNGGTIKISMTGTGGKGIKAAGSYTQGIAGGDGPSLTVSTTGSSFGSSSSSGNQGGWGGMGGGMQQNSGSSAKAIKVMGEAVIYGGTSYVTTATNGAEGLESKTSINIAGGAHYFKTYDDCINCSGVIKFSGGSTVCYATNNDAVDSNYGRSGAITIAGGNVFAYTTAGSPEEGLDCDNNAYITVSGGIAVSAGGQQGGSSSGSIGSSTQGYYIGASPSSYSSSNYYTLCSTSGTPLCTFKFAGNVTNALGLLTATNLGKGSFTVKQGTAKPTACDVNVNDVFFINPTVTTSSTTATLTAR